MTHYLNGLIWRETDVGLFQSDINDEAGFQGSLIVSRSAVGGYVVGVWTLLPFSYSSDLEQTKELTQAFLDAHPKALEALRTLWNESMTFAKARSNKP